MKMLPAGTAAISNFAPYSRNCNLGQCRVAYYALVPSLSDVQLFINLGTVKPSAIDFTIFNLCGPFDNDTINSNCFIIAFNGSYWYAIYKNFTGPAYPTFIIAASVSYTDETVKTFFSEQYQIQSDCDTLTKVSVCYPYNWNSEDINDIYVGQPDLSQAVSGKADLFYHHQYWVKGAEIIETSNKITFTSNLFRNFNTDLKKLYEFRPTDLIPGWYKDYLLAVYFRGNIFINDAQAMVSDVNFENVNEAADQWKPYAILSKEVKGAFGCADIVCPQDCICVPVTLPSITFADAVIGQLYNKTVAINGTAPFTISSIVKPAWMTIVLMGSNLQFIGMPAEEAEDEEISFTLNNCTGDESFVDFEGSINSVILNWFIAYTNNIGTDNLTVYIGNHGSTPSHILYSGLYSADPLSGTDLVNFPAVDMTVLLLVPGKNIISASCNGSTPTGGIGTSAVTFTHINGSPFNLDFITA
jgi:hypothetical protein